MILEVMDFVRCVPVDPTLGRKTTLVRVETTNPVYLVFDETQDSPRLVVRVGDRGQLVHEHDVLERLHQRVPDLVARSLYLASWKDDRWVHVQTGLPGTPWFRLQASLRSLHDWLPLRDRALVALRELHRAIRQDPSWREERVDPAAELDGQVGRAGPRISRLKSAVTTAERTLAGLKPLTWYVQHGDFCINNLIFDTSGARVIDFEEFGLTAVPLHDEFGLGLSLWDLMPAGGDSLADQLGCVLHEPLARNPWLADHLEGLFLHHLLWRVSRCRAEPGRAAMASRLEGLIQDIGPGIANMFDRIRRQSLPTIL